MHPPDRPPRYRAQDPPARPHGLTYPRVGGRPCILDLASWILHLEGWVGEGVGWGGEPPHPRMEVVSVFAGGRSVLCRCRRNRPCRELHEAVGYVVVRDGSPRHVAVFEPVCVPRWIRVEMVSGSARRGCYGLVQRSGGSRRKAAIAVTRKAFCAIRDHPRTRSRLSDEALFAELRHAVVVLSDSNRANRPRFSGSISRHRYDDREPIESSERTVALARKRIPVLTGRPEGNVSRWMIEPEGSDLRPIGQRRRGA